MGHVAISCIFCLIYDYFQVRFRLNFSCVSQPMPQLINERNEFRQNDYMPGTANAVIHKGPLLLPAARWEAAAEKENSPGLPANCCALCCILLKI